MIYSMTAFSRLQSEAENFSLVCEVRSINHRYLEISLHLPDALRSFEMLMREKIRHLVQRGKIECSFRYQIKASNTSALKINLSLAKELCEASEEVGSFLRQPGAISPTDIIKFPHVLETQEANKETLQAESLQLLESTFRDLIAARKREGDELTQLLLQRIALIQAQLANVKARLPQVIAEQQERIKKRFADIKLELDANRLEQEIVIFSHKVDIAEEIERTETHLLEINRILKTGGLVGRRLDFLLQELNREANTLGSKSVDSVITHAGVEMKVLIEQIREQVQNIE